MTDTPEAVIAEVTVLRVLHDLEQESHWDFVEFDETARVIRHLLAQNALLSALVQQLRTELEAARTRAIMAEQHKTLSLLGKSSWQEVVEEKLRVELAEAQVAKDAAEAERDALRQYAQHKLECESLVPINRLHRPPCTCGLAAALQQDVARLKAGK